MSYLFLAIGGAIGTLLRFALALLIEGRFDRLTFPWGTFAVNLTGSLLIGFAAGYSSSHSVSPEAKLFIFVGLLGGFTTFSSLALEGFSLFRNGQAAMAVIYLLSSNIAGVLLAFLGYYIGNGFSLTPKH